MGNIPLWMILLGVGAVIGLGLILYNVFFVEEEDDEEEGFEGGHTTAVMDDDTLGETLASTQEDIKMARKSRMIALKDSLERSLEGKEGEGAETRDRMSMPWYLLVGAPGSGKTTMLANTGLPLPYGPAFEVDSRKRDAGRWWLYQDAVVLEAPPASAGQSATQSTLAPGQTIAGDASEGWNTLLHMLRRERPDAPLNGIVVTVSCADLVSGRRDSEKLAEQADRIRAFLDRTRKVLEVRLPLHILVTKCDVLPGFRSFAENLPEGRRNDIFGWANPNKLEMPFNASWVDQGCETLRKALEDLRDEVLAAPDEIKDADGLFVFVSEFGDLQEPLRDFISRLYPPDEKRPPLFFRGMYFAGDTIDPEVQAAAAKEHQAAGKSRATMQLSAEQALTGGTSSHKLVFLKSLFTDKIFKEAGLAKPVARFTLSRDRRVVVAQIAAAIILLVGGGGLWTSLYGFKRGDSVVQSGLRDDAEALAHVLAGMAIDLDDVKRTGTGTAADSGTDRRLRDAAVIDLVDEMRVLHSLKRSPFIPASWFSPLPDEVRKSMQSGIQEIVLPVIRQRLEERAASLLEVSPIDSTVDAVVMGDPRALADYLNEVRTLSRHVTLYNRLASPTAGSLGDLSLVLDYLFGVRLEGNSNLTSEDFQSALRMAEAPRITLAPEVATTVVNRSVGMMASLGELAGRQLAPPRNVQAQRAIKPEDDLLALRRLGTLVELSDPRRGVVASVTDSTILGVNLARLVEDSINSQLRRAAALIVGDTLALDLVVQQMRTSIDTLFALRLMEPALDGEIISDFNPGERLRWDVGRLQLVLDMRGEQNTAVVTVARILKGQPTERLVRAFDVQMRTRALAAAASAQRITPITAGDAATVEVMQGAANLEAAVPRLNQLSVLLDSLKATTEARQLLAAATRQAEHVLALAHSLVQTDDRLLPQPDKIVAWQGVIPFAWAAVGVSEALPFAAAALPFEKQVRDLSTQVEPVLTFLTSRTADSSRVTRLVAEWNGLRATMKKADGDATSSMEALRKYLRDDLSPRDIETCVKAAALPDTSKPTPDPFVVRRKRFRAALTARCGRGGNDAAVAYEKVRSTFNSRLAGRYPFVDSARAADAPDADPAVLRDFFKQFDTFMIDGEVALRSDPALAAPAKNALDFLVAMKRFREFVVPVANATDRRPAEYQLLVQPVDSVMNRQLVVAGRSVPIDLTAHSTLWRFGEQVRVTQRDSTRTRLLFASVGNWGVLQLQNQASLRYFDPSTKIELQPPSVIPITAPAIVVPK